MSRRDRGGLAVPPANVPTVAEAAAELVPDAQEPAPKPARTRTASSRPRTQSKSAASAPVPETAQERLYDALIASGGRGRQVLAARGLQVEASQGMRPMNVALPVALANAINAVTDRESNPKRDLVIALLYAYCEDMGVQVAS